MESKLGRRINILTKTALVGTVALTGSMVFSGVPIDAKAQTLTQAKNTDASSSMLIMDSRLNQSPFEQKPGLPPPFVPQPYWSEPTDMNEIVALAAREMRIDENKVRDILGCESQFDPSAINPSGARGLWQIMPVHVEKFAARLWDYWKDWSNAYRNTMVAVDISRDPKGFNNWSCFRR